MRILTLFVLLVTLSGVAMGQTESPTARIQRLTRDIKQFNAFEISPRNEDQWAHLRAQGISHSQAATTDLNLKVTYVRVAFMNSADDRLVRRVLLHEAGHIYCRCVSEQAAEKFAEEHAR